MTRTPARIRQADVARAIRTAGDDATFIYFLRAGPFVKIGRSKVWKTRLAQMQVGSPYDIVPLLVLIGDRKLEKTLHRKFRADHYRGEWFHTGPAITAYVKENRARCVARSTETDLRSEIEIIL